MKILCIEGGGYTSTYAACIIDSLSKRINKPILDEFDLICGSSTGAIMILALAGGVKPDELFTWWQTSRFGQSTRLSAFSHFNNIFQPKYNSQKYKAYISEIVPEYDINSSKLRFCLTSISLFDNALFPIRSYGCEGPINSRDAALAVSSIPAFFQPHRLGNHLLLDGGLVANVPDLVALKEAATDPGCCEVLSIGSPYQRRKELGSIKRWGAFTWLRDLFLIRLMVTAQERFVVDFMRTLLGDRYYRFEFEIPVEQYGISRFDRIDPNIQTMCLRRGQQDFDTFCASEFASRNFSFI